MEESEIIAHRAVLGCTDYIYNNITFITWKMTFNPNRIVWLYNIVFVCVAVGTYPMMWYVIYVNQNYVIYHS